MCHGQKTWIIYLHWERVIHQLRGIYIVTVGIPIPRWMTVIHVPWSDQQFRDLNLTLENLGEILS